MFRYHTLVRQTVRNGYSQRDETYEQLVIADDIDKVADSVRDLVASSLKNHKTQRIELTPVSGYEVIDLDASR